MLDKVRSAGQTVGKGVGVLIVPGLLVAAITGSYINYKETKTVESHLAAPKIITEPIVQASATPSAEPVISPSLTPSKPISGSSPAARLKIVK